MVIGLVFDDSQYLTIEGNHISDKTDFDVTGVSFYSSALTDLPINFFIKFFNLEYLYLNFGSLVNIDVTSFAFAVNMKKLDAAYNKVKKLDALVFAGASLGLESIDLSSNEIAEINQFAFDSLISLKSLNLNSNKIVILPPTIFASLTSLNNLLLDFNQVGVLPAGLLDQNVNLKAINMMFNKINATASTLFQKNTALETLFLAGNICINSNIYLAYENWTTTSLPKFTVCFENAIA